MPLRRNQNIKIFSSDPTDRVTRILYTPGMVNNVVHETQIPGGFWTFEFQRAMTDAEYWDFRLNYLIARLDFEVRAGKVAWQGRIEDITGEPRNPKIRARGYYSLFTDMTTNNATHTREWNTTPDAIVKDILSNGFHADMKASFNSDVSNIDSITTSILLEPDNAEQEHFNYWRVLTDDERGLSVYSEGTDNQYVDLAVWDDRKVYLKQRGSLTDINWRSYRQMPPGGVTSLPFKVSWQDVYNAAAATYGNSRTKDSFTSDGDSINKYGRREVMAPYLGQETNSTDAGRRKSGIRQNAADPQLQTDSITLNRVFDNQGNETSLCEVRAGEVLNIPDMIPSSSGLSVNLDALRTFVIARTTCNHSRGELIIRPDRKSKGLNALLARAHLSSI